MMRRGLILAVGFMVLLAGLPLTARAQSAQTPAMAIATVDQERLFAGSLWGRRVIAELEAAKGSLQAENRKIEADLTQEEQDLTEKRVTLKPEEFRPLADAFDAKVTAIRKEQDRKGRDLAARQDQEQKAFLTAALPIMGEVMTEHGASVILDKRAVFLAATSIDLTDAIIARLDEKLGAGPAPAGN